MKRTIVFVSPQVFTEVTSPGGATLKIPLIPGVLKHLRLDELPTVLQLPGVLEKYTHQAIRWAPWQCLQEFPISWLRECLQTSSVREGRRMAIEFLISGKEANRAS